MLQTENDLSKTKRNESINIIERENENMNNEFKIINKNSTDAYFFDRLLQMKFRTKSRGMRHKMKTFLCRRRGNKNICDRLGITPAPTISTSPSSSPSSSPSFSPSQSKSPSKSPSARPSTIPSTLPSLKHSVFPSEYPSTIPTIVPSSYPSFNPTEFPTIQPSTFPSLMPITYQETCQFSTNVDALECKEDLASNIEEESFRTITEDEYICSENKKYRFGITLDQYLCLCDNRNNKKLWCVDSDDCCQDGRDPYVVLERNGNLVAYSERFLFSRFRTQMLWESDTQGTSGAFPVQLKLHNDGSLKIQDTLDSNIIHWQVKGNLKENDAKADCR